MSLFPKVAELVIDFARGVHLWPLVNWLVDASASPSPAILLAQLANADIHLLVAMVVLAETISSFLSAKGAR